MLEQAHDWLIDHACLYDGEGVTTAFLLLLVNAVLLPRQNRRRVAGQAVLLLLYPIACLMREPFPPHSVGHKAVTAVAFMTLLVYFGRAVALLVFEGILARLGRPLPRIAVDLTQMVVFVAALLIVLQQAGVEPGALFTGSAVLTAVLGFALRDTLGNLFAGLALQIQKPFDVGDWIMYDQHQYHIGEVVEINWRATRVLTLDKAEVILPNGMLANANIRNFTKPLVYSRRSVYVVAPYDVPPNRVREIIMAAVPGSFGVLTDPPPSVVTNEFKERGVEYWVRFFTDQFGFRDKVDGEVRDRIWYAFARHGIRMPVATHEVRMTAVPPPPPAPPAVEDRRRLLADVDFFSLIPEEGLNGLAERAIEKLYAAGETIIRQGDRGATLYLLVKGEVRVTAASSGSDAVEVARLGPGAFFGEMSLLTGAPRSATVTAATECRVLGVDKAALEPVLRENPELAGLISQLLAERRTNLIARLEYGSSPPEQKKALLDHIREFFSLG